jgi:hypothetical protein
MELRRKCVPLTDSEYDTRIKKVLEEFLLADAKAAMNRGDRGAGGVVTYVTSGPDALTDESTRRMAIEWLHEEADALGDKDDEYYISRLADRIGGYTDAEEG